MCFKLNNDSGKNLFFNCYLHYYNYGRNYKLHIVILHRINLVVKENKYTDVMILGDFNCNIGKVLFSEKVVFFFIVPNLFILSLMFLF